MRLSEEEWLWYLHRYKKEAATWRELEPEEIEAWLADLKMFIECHHAETTSMELNEYWVQDCDHSWVPEACQCCAICAKCNRVVQHSRHPVNWAEEE